MRRSFGNISDIPDYFVISFFGSLAIFVMAVELAQLAFYKEKGYRLTAVSRGKPPEDQKEQ